MAFKGYEKGMLCFPGLIQMFRGRPLQGVFIFFLVFSPAAFLMQKKFLALSLTSLEEKIVVGLFVLGMLCHWVSLFSLGDASSNTGSSSSNLPKEDLYEKGRLASLKGNWELACICFERLIQKKPNDEDAIYQLGRTYLELGKQQKVKILFQNYLEGSASKWRVEIKGLYEELST